MRNFLNSLTLLSALLAIFTNFLSEFVILLLPLLTLCQITFVGTKEL